MATSTAAFDQSEQASQARVMRPIDRIHLAKQCLGDEHLELEVLRLFDTTIATYFGRLLGSVSPDMVTLNLHTIKGAASGVGAWIVADLAKACEVELQEGRPLTPERLADLGIAVEEVRSAIARMIAGQPDE